MPADSIQGQGYRIQEWPSFWLVKLEENFGLNTPTELERDLTADAVNAKPGLPFVFDTTAYERIIPSEMRFFIGLKKRGTQFCIVLNAKYLLTLREAGLENTFAHGATARLALNALGISYRPRIDADLINPFLEATLKVISVQTGGQPQAGKPYLVKESIKANLIGMIPLVGPMLGGMITLEFPKETFLALASHVLGEKYAEITPDIESFAAEMTNMVYGTGRVKANAAGYGLQQSLPSLLREAASGPSTTNKTVIGIPIDTGMGPLHLTVRIDS